MTATERGLKRILILLSALAVAWWTVYWLIIARDPLNGRMFPGDFVAMMIPIFSARSIGLLWTAF